MPKFLMLSDCGDGAFLLRRLMQEGHQVELCLYDPIAKDVYKGLVPITKRQHPSPGEIVLFDMVKHGAAADRLRMLGYKVIGAGTVADQLEINRPFGMRMMREIGIRIPETYVFRSLSEGQRFLDAQQGVWYFKPSGSLPTYMTYNDEARPLKRYLEYAKRQPPEQFELQKKMEGTEVSLEGWFDGTRFVWPFNSTVEDKKLMVDDKGPRTGCMANIVWAYEEPRPVLAVKTITRIAPILERAGYVGPIDLNVMIDPEGVPYGLEWSPRFGYDALQALSLLTQGDLGRQLVDFANGSLDHFDVRTDSYALTINISVPPYPNAKYAKDWKGLPLDAAMLNNPYMAPRDVMMGPTGLEMAGSDGCVTTIGAVGTDIGLLRKEVLTAAETLHIPHAQYRTDPVMRTESVLTALSSFGYEGSSVRVVDERTKEIPAPSVPKAVGEGRQVPGENSRVVPVQPAMANPNWEAPTHS